MARLGKMYPNREIPAPTARNKAGFAAYRPATAEEVAELLFLGTFGTTFYASGQEWADGTLEVLKHAVREDAQFVAQAAVLAREEGYVRSAPIMALSVLLAGDPGAKSWGVRIFDRIVRTGDDLRNFVGLNLSGQIRKGYGGIARREAARWINAHLDEYQALKYGDVRGHDPLNFRNILRLTHPKPGRPWKEDLYRWIVQGVGSERLPRIQAADRLRRGEQTPAQAILQGNLPFETVMPILGSDGHQADAEAWAALTVQAPYFFLLRSLAAIGRAGVWADPGLVQAAARRLTDPDAVRVAKVFPYRFWQAAQVLYRERAPQALVDAVAEAMELSLSNLPTLPERTVLALDVSGSMATTQVARDTSAAVIGGLFAAALWKRTPTARLLPFDSDVRRVPHVSPRDSLMTLTNALAMRGGGTDLSSPIRLLLQERTPVTLFIGLTDSEDWAASGGWHGQGFLAAWQHYRQIVAPEAQAVLIQLVPGRTRVAPPDTDGVRYVYGWSDAVVRYVGHVAQGGTITERVRQVTL